MNAQIWTLIAVLVTILLGVLGYIIGYALAKKSIGVKLREADERSGKLLDEAKREAEALKRVSLLETKEEIAKKQDLFEKQVRERKNDLRNSEQAFEEKEKNLEKKNDMVRKKETSLLQRERELLLKEKTIKAKNDRLTKLIEDQNAKLEQMAQMSKDEALKILMLNLETEAKLSAANMIKQMKEDALQKASKEAKEIVTMAIQRSATDHVVESTVSVVSLPSDEMKGRIIGREGRNIRTFENATGVEVIIDDTPDAVTISGFDPIRREIARLALSKLVSDGRIHPTRIEEVVKKTQEQMEETIKNIGEDTLVELNIPNMHPELVKMLGRLKYRTSYGQNVLQHSKEVAYLAKMMADELDIDNAHLAKRAGLLHDIGKAVDQNFEGTHTKIGSELAKKYGENDIVINSIESHHEDVQAETLVSILVAAADSISGARPGARRETLEAYIERLENLEEIANGFNGVEKAYAIQAGREIRVIAVPEQISDAEADELSQQIARKIEQELKYPGQIKVTVIRETRSIDYAK
ncbi:MAG: ribonuclease Y [bacterium]|nr:ribonuclease Y [bacterium]